MAEKGRNPRLNFEAALKGHLARYKDNVLGVSDDGDWKGTPYSHILPRELGHLNLTPDIRDACWEYLTASGVQLHQYFHHLNSSQAFALNLFFPFLAGGAQGQGALLRALGLDGSISEWEFEAVPDPSEGTNFDVLLDLKNGRRIFIEVKLTESGFGKVNPKDRHLRKREEVYLPRLRGLVRAEALEVVAFFRRYQLLRNISFVDPARGDELLLVFPRANAEVLGEAEAVFAVLEDEMVALVRIVDTEAMTTALLQSSDLPAVIRRSMEELALKYSPTAASA